MIVRIVVCTRAVFWLSDVLFCDTPGYGIARWWGTVGFYEVSMFWIVRHTHTHPHTHPRWSVWLCTASVNCRRLLKLFALSLPSLPIT